VARPGVTAPPPDEADVERIRAFLAVDPGDALRARIAALVAAWRDAPWGRHVRWVRPETLHLTLRFLGDVTPAELDAVGAAVGEVVAVHAPGHVAITGVGPFPARRRPSVIALRLADHAGLAALAADVEAACVRVGLEPEARGFRPHLTLGRLRGRVPRRVLGWTEHTWATDETGRSGAGP